MKKNILSQKVVTVILTAAVTFSMITFPFTTSAATLSNGMNAAYVIGAGSASQDFTNNTQGTTSSTFSAPRNALLDETNNRLFVADSGNHRVLVFDTDSDGVPLDYTADYVLGQADFTSAVQTTTQTGMNTPEGLGYDSANDRLFVGMTTGSSGRVLVFDVSTITNGEAAVNVLGQEDFTSDIVVTDQDGVRFIQAIEYDQVNDLLYVSDKFRVLVYDVSTITDGEDAVNVLGKPNFTSEVAAANASTTGDGAGGLVLDGGNDRLFVNDRDSHRVLVFDVSTITDGEPAVNVLGQTDFVSSASGTTASTFTNFMELGFSVVGLGYDSTNERLFATDGGSNRVLVFDVSTITDGEPAVKVIGQEDFTSSGTAVTQSNLSFPFLGSYSEGVEKYYVADFGNNRILIFDLSPTAASGKGYVKPPVCSANFSPSSITKGESTNFSWQVSWPTEKYNTYYTRVPGKDGGLFSHRVSSLQMYPEHTQTITMYTFNLYGATPCEATVEVLDENGEELTSKNNAHITATASNSPLVRTILSFFSSIFIR